MANPKAPKSTPPAAASPEPAASPSPEPNGSATPATAPSPADPMADSQALDELFSALKTLLSTVDKLQKARQEVGDIKPLMVRMLDGELLSGEELEQLKSGVSSLSRLVKVYGDYQSALEKAQPARNLLDTVLK